jgi:hypothetical protein
METLRILVANDPRSYREAISCALGILRPHLEVVLLEPEDLEDRVSVYAPALVLCSRLTPTVRREAFAWVELYPEGKPFAAISVDGLQLRAVGDIDIANLLWIADRAALAAGSRDHPGVSRQA